MPAEKKVWRNRKTRKELARQLQSANPGLEAKRVVPNKPIKYLINTHHHFDHSGGLRTYVAEGSTIIITVKDKYTLADGGRSLEIYPLEGDTHNSGLMMVYMRKEKVLVEADDFSWPAGTRAGPRYHANNVNLYRNIQRLKLDVKTIAPIHGEPVPLSELQKTLT